MIKDEHQTAEPALLIGDRVITLEQAEFLARQALALPSEFEWQMLLDMMD